MAGDQNGDPMLPVQLQNQFPDLNDALGIETVDGFIQHEKVRVSRKGNGDAQSLPHTERKILYLLLPGVTQSHKLQQFRDPVIGRLPQNPVLVLHVISGCHIQIDGRGFHHRAHPAAGFSDLCVRILNAVDLIASNRGELQACDQPDQGRLSGTVFAHKSIDGPFRHMHV